MQLSGYIISQYVEAAVLAGEKIRGGYGKDLPAFFGAFVNPSPRSSVPSEEMIRILEFLNRVNADERLADIIQKARELSWELVLSLRPGTGISANPYLLMPTHLRSGCIVIERVVAEAGNKVEDTVNALYGDSVTELERRIRLGTATPKDSSRYGLLRFALDAARETEDDRAYALIDGFDIIEELRNTDYRCVYLAINKVTGERVTLKTLTTKGARIRREREVFELGARRLNRIRDPLIPQVVFPLTRLADGRMFYAVQYRPGRPLTNTPEIKVVDKASLIRRIVMSISRLHREGLVHGDISPSNIIIEDDLSVSFIDFECVAPPETSLLSRIYDRSTDRYTSPERRMNSIRLKATDDVYALGILMTDIIKGSFDGSPEDVLTSLREDPSMRQFADVISCCLSDEAGGRYRDAEEVMGALTATTSSPEGFGRRPAIRSSPFVRTLSGRTLEGEKLSSQDLRTYDFSNARLIGCDFSDALMTNTSFQNTVIERCRFDGAFLILSRFLGTAIDRASSFTDANLERTVWDDVDLAGVDFRWANLWGAFLGRARNLDGANLANANFYRNELTGDQRRVLLKLGNRIMQTGSYGAMAREWTNRGRGSVVWWLQDCSRPGGLLTLY
jgi:serine/threonine protein kinase